jgi:hypothetical protein
MQRLCLMIMLAGALACPGFAFAHSTGSTVAGNSGQVAGMTCGNCHAAGTPPTVALTGPAAMAAGTTAQFTFTVTGTTTVAGLDVAASSAAATLAPVSPSVQLAAGEIVHKAPQPLSGGKAVFTFTLTAPPTSGTLTLYGAGVAGNSGGDGHGAKTTLAIEVTGGAAVDGGEPDLGTDMATSGVGGNGGTVPPATSGSSQSTQGGYGCSVVDRSSNASPLACPLLLAIGFSLLRARSVARRRRR